MKHGNPRTFSTSPVQNDGGDVVAARNEAGVSALDVETLLHAGDANIHESVDNHILWSNYKDSRVRSPGST